MHFQATVKLICSVSRLQWWMCFIIFMSKCSTIVSKLAWNPPCVCACVMFSLSHETKKKCCNAIMAPWTFVISIIWRECLTACNANRQRHFRAEVNEDHASGLKQFINVPSASFLCFLASSLPLSFNIPLPFEWRRTHASPPKGEAGRYAVPNSKLSLTTMGVWWLSLSQSRVVGGIGTRLSVLVSLCYFNEDNFKC